MPCSSGQDLPPVQYQKGHDPYYQQKYGETVTKLNEVTDLLCQAGRAFKGGQPVPPAVLNWWEQHAKFDHTQGRPWPAGSKGPNDDQ